MASPACHGIHPILKWPGGKRALLPVLTSFFPESYNRYFEPFLGGGAVFFSLAPHMSFLSDTCNDVIVTYEAVRDNLDLVISELDSFRISEAEYYSIRRWKPSNKYQQAARIIYLTSLSFNGLYRVNHLGEFNVPYGHRDNRQYYNRDHLEKARLLLLNARLTICDFEQSLSKARVGDLVYLDPPYTVAHGENGFIKYNESLFTWQDQLRLFDIFEQLCDLGCYVYLSNANHHSILTLYKEYEINYVSRPSVIAASSQARASITELIIVGKKRC